MRNVHLGQRVSAYARRTSALLVAPERSRHAYIKTRSNPGPRGRLHLEAASRFDFGLFFSPLPLDIFRNYPAVGGESGTGRRGCQVLSHPGTTLAGSLKRRDRRSKVGIRSSRMLLPNEAVRPKIVLDRPGRSMVQLTLDQYSYVSPSRQAAIAERTGGWFGNVAYAGSNPA